MSPCILKTGRARLAQTLDQRGPGPGPRWPAICQVLDFTIDIDPPVTDVGNRRFASLFKSLRPACSLLRQVCIFSGWNRRPFPFSGLFHLGDGAACPADVSPRQGGRHAVFGLSLAILAVNPSLARAENEWHRGSSFASGSFDGTWKKDGFEKSPALSTASSHPKSRGPWRFTPDPDATPLANLRSLISAAEAGSANYDSVQYGAIVKPTKLPTAMTIDEIRAWVAATPGQNHAIGRYQFIPPTFERLASLTGIAGTEEFSADLQDRWADILLAQAGYVSFFVGDIAPETFMDNVATVWAGLPLADGTSAYEGIAGNHATVSRAAYAQGMAMIFPAQNALAAARR
jgi:hypothetical protein